MKDCDAQNYSVWRHFLSWMVWINENSSRSKSEHRRQELVCSCRAIVQLWGFNRPFMKGEVGALSSEVRTNDHVSLIIKHLAIDHLWDSRLVTGDLLYMWWKNECA